MIALRHRVVPVFVATPSNPSAWEIMTFTEALLYIKNYVHVHVMLWYQYHTKAMIE
jgi:hypothetical protein